jgi:hypothetical protein
MGPKSAHVSSKTGKTPEAPMTLVKSEGVTLVLFLHSYRHNHHIPH